MTKHLSWIVMLVWALPAAAQINTGTRDNKGMTVGMGQIKEDPNTELNRMRRAYESSIKLANDMITQKRYSEARDALEKAAVNRNPLIEAQATELVDLYTKLDAEGQQMLGEARKDYQGGKYAQALKTYRMISYQFGQLPSAKIARQELKKAGNDESAQASMQDEKAQAMEDMITRVIDGYFASKAPKGGGEDEPKAGKSGDRATADKAGKADKGPTSRPADRAEQIKLMPPSEIVRVVKMLENLARVFPASSAGKQAAADVKALKADKTVGKVLARPGDSDAGRALAKAENYRKAGLTEKAAEFFREVVEKYPDTPEAAKAKEALAGL